MDREHELRATAAAFGEKLDVCDFEHLVSLIHSGARFRLIVDAGGPPPHPQAIRCGRCGEHSVWVVAGSAEELIGWLRAPYVIAIRPECDARPGSVRSRGEQE